MEKDLKQELIENLKKGFNVVVIGKSGWDKTSAIKEVAESLGYKILSVYASNPNDLGYDPQVLINRESDPKNIKFYEKFIKEGRNIPPEWANIALNNPGNKFLLNLHYIEECDTDTLDVWKTLITKKTICGEHLGNVVVCAEYSIFDNATPKTTTEEWNFFDKAIILESHNEDSKRAAMEHLRNEWFSKINNEEFFDLLIENAMMFESPRLVETYILKNLHTLIQKPGSEKIYRVDSFYRKYKSLLTDEAKENSRKYEDVLQRMAEIAYNIIKG